MSLASEMGVLTGGLDEAVLDCAFPVTLVRAFPSATGDAAKGRVNPPIERRSTIQLSVQPMTQKELQMLPEGMRNTGAVKCYGPDELKTVDTSACRVPDKFIYHDVIYQIQSVDDWVDLGSYYKTTAVRVTR